MADNRGDALLLAIKPGQVWRIDYGRGHHATGRIHIRAIFDSHVIVVCRWSFRSKSWVYSIENVWFFVESIKSGRMKMIKKAANDTH